MTLKLIQRRSFILCGLILPLAISPAFAGTEGRRRKDGKSHSSNVIRAVQAELVAQGYDPKGVDGKMGGNTSAAIQKYQQDFGLNVTGQINDELLISLGLVADTNA